MSDSDEGPELLIGGDPAYLTNVVKPGVHDVLCGRGGGTNNHSGNVKFRQLVNEHKITYLAASKVEKPKVAREVVKLWRALDPPGRFLARTDDSKRGPGSVKAEGNVWYDVGDKKGREKASQCLRERTPEVLPYVREMQRQQDLRTGQGLRMVEHQMRIHQESQMNVGMGGILHTSMSPVNGQTYQVQPSQVNSLPIPNADMANAFSDQFFFNPHGFQPTPDSFVTNESFTTNTRLNDVQDASNDSRSRQQMSQNHQSWNINNSAYETTMLPGGFPGASIPRHSNNIRPDPVNCVSSQSVLPDDFNFDDPDGELTLEEYRTSFREFEHLVLEDSDSELDALKKDRNDLHENAWVRSFHVIDNPHLNGSSGMLDNSASSFGDMIQVQPRKPPPATKAKPTLDSALSRQKLVKTGQSTWTVQTSGTFQTTGTMQTTGTQKSAISQKTSLSAAFSTMSGVSMFSGMSSDTRLSKMSAARGLNSNLSMMSELTDLSETLNSLDLSKANPPNKRL